MAKADEEALEAKVEKKNAEIRELKKDASRLEKLNRKYRRDMKAIESEPNVVQLAVTGLSMAAGVGAGIAGHRKLRQVTQTWRNPVDSSDQTAKAALEAYKAGTATPEQLEYIKKSTTRKASAVLVSEVLPIVAGLVTGGATAMSDNGVVASVGGLGWGLAAGTLLDVVLPGAPPPPPKPKA